MKIYGVNPVAEALKSNYPVLKIYISENFKDREGIIPVAREKGIKISMISKKKLLEISGTSKNQGIVAIVSPVEPKPFEKLVANCIERKGILLFLDRIEDPHNLGAIFRTSDAFAINGIVIPKDRSATITETAVKTSTGAVFHVPFSIVNSFINAIITFKNSGGWIIGLECGGKDIGKYRFPFPLGLVVGSEGKGLSKATINQLDDIVEIPMKGHVNSLNVSNATAIGLYLAFRQKEGGTDGKP